ncbi:MAG: F0F1 ATP synthase subunit delta [Candidatus Saccharimonadales bacterium]|nr:F0F1 ATP synthase subunit delta [Candidatus Saccharimonadales bacterium]
MTSRRQLARYIATAWIERTVPRSDLIKQMAGYLLENGRSNEVDLLVSDIKQQIEEQYGVTVANVASARPLSDQLRTHIKELVKEKTGAKSVRLSEEIDENLVGGAVVDTPGLSIDLSVRGKLNNLRSRS